MAFEELKSALGQEFVGKKKFERGRPLFEQLTKLRGAEAEDLLFGIAQKKKIAEARKEVNDFLIRVDSVPMSQFELSEEEQRHLDAVSELGDPEALRQTENKLKFGKMIRQSPGITEAIGLVSPDFGEKLLGITAKRDLIDVSGRQAVATKKAELEETGLSAEHKRKLSRIDRNFDRAIDLAHVKGLYDKKTASSKDDRIKFALDTVRQLKLKLANPEDIPVEDVPKIEDDINKLIKYINDRSKGKDVDLPKQTFVGFEEVSVEDNSQQQINEILGLEPEIP
jgi:hypothetical protein